MSIFNTAVEYKPFVVGEKVLWCGIIGEVVETNYSDAFWVDIWFESGVKLRFLGDGRFYSWHAEPSLLRLI